MVTYYYLRVRFFSVCVSDIPTKYKADVRARLRAAGLNDCGKTY